MFPWFSISIPGGDGWSHFSSYFQPWRTSASSASSSTCWRHSPGRSWDSSGYSEPSRLRTKTAATTATPTGLVQHFIKSNCSSKILFFFSSLSLHWSYWMVWWMFGFVLKSVSSSTGLSSRRNKTWQFTTKLPSLLDFNFRNFSNFLNLTFLYYNMLQDCFLK